MTLTESTTPERVYKLWRCATCGEQGWEDERQHWVGSGPAVRYCGDYGFVQVIPLQSTRELLIELAQEYHRWHAHLNVPPWHSCSAELCRRTRSLLSMLKRGGEGMTEQTKRLEELERALRWLLLNGEE